MYCFNIIINVESQLESSQTCCLCCILIIGITDIDECYYVIPVTCVVHLMLSTGKCCSVQYLLVLRSLVKLRNVSCVNHKQNTQNSKSDDESNIQSSQSCRFRSKKYKNTCEFMLVSIKYVVMFLSDWLTMQVCLDAFIHVFVLNTCW